MNKKFAILIAVILAILLFIVLKPSNYPPMTGTVVDAVTGQPIEGAVVLVEWTKTHGIGEHWTESFKVEEAVTDKDGKFTVTGLNARSINPPDVTVYKKGYVAWSSRWIFPGYENRTDFSWKDYVFKLDRFKEGYSYIDHTDFLRSCINSSIKLETKQNIYRAFYWETQLASKERDQKAKK